MSNLNRRNITNHFQDVHLATQEGYDPEDMKLIADEFGLGRSGSWLSLGHFFRMPVPDRRAEYVFGTATEVMRLMKNLPSKVAILRPGEEAKSAPATPETDEMAAAYQAERNQTPGQST